MSGELGGPGTKLFFREAIAQALREEMRHDARVIVMGQDVGPMGGSYKEFLGLYDEFGSTRVRNMPVAEAAMIGVAAGAAAAGMKPLVSVTYMDFLPLGLDALVNYAAKLSYKTGGQMHAPVIVKATAGAKGQGVAHSQCLEAWLIGVPGLKIVAPATPADAYGLLLAAFRENGPVLFIDHKRLFSTAGEVPLGQTGIRIGKAAVIRRGADVTVATHSWMTVIAQQAATKLAREGISAEIIDLRTLAPLDVATICDSVNRTRALVTLEEGQTTGGIGCEVAFRVQEQLGGTKVGRVGAAPAPVSFNPMLEAATLPDAERVITAVRRLLEPGR